VRGAGRNDRAGVVALRDRRERHRGLHGGGHQRHEEDAQVHVLTDQPPERTQGHADDREHQERERQDEQMQPPVQETLHRLLRRQAGAVEEEEERDGDVRRGGEPLREVAAGGQNDRHHHRRDAEKDERVSPLEKGQHALKFTAAAEAPPSMGHMTLLFSPLRLRDLEIRNRAWMPPMCQYHAFDSDGTPEDWHLVHYGARAAGGFGLLIAEATGVVPEGRISPLCTGLWNDRQEKAWARIVQFVHAQGAKMGIQLNHAGRKASTAPWRPGLGEGSVPLGHGGWRTVGPSPIAQEGIDEPREMTVE